MKNISLGLIFVSTVINASVAELQNSVQVAKVLKQQINLAQINQSNLPGGPVSGVGGSSQKGGNNKIALVTPPSLLFPGVYTLPVGGAQNQCSAETCNFTGKFAPVSAIGGAVYSDDNGNSISCSEKLNFINIGFTDDNADSFYTMQFNFKDLDAAGILPYIRPDGVGIYIVMNLVQADGQNYIQVLLQNAQNNQILAQAVSSPISGGITQANIGFNMHDTLHAPGNNQKRLNGFQLASKQRVWYKQVNSESQVPLTRNPAQILPSGSTPIPSLLIPNVYSIPLGPQNLCVSSSCNDFAGNFVPVNATNGAIYSDQNGSAVCCSGQLKLISIGLTDANAQNFYSIEFTQQDFDKAGITPLLELDGVGIFIVINLIEAGYKNFIQVLLQNAQNNQVLAQAVSSAINGGITQANIGFNVRGYNNLVAKNSNQAVLNGVNISLGQRIQYHKTQLGVYGFAAYQVPPANIGCSDNICNFTGNFAPVNAQKGPVCNYQQGSAISLQNGLQFINVGLTDVNQQSFYSFTFDAAALSQSKIQDALRLNGPGIYIAINLIQKNNQNYAEVMLTDVKGLVFAKAISNDPIQGGLVYANIGFNMHNTLHTANNDQTYVNQFMIGSGQRIWYANTGANVNKTMSSWN